MVYQKGDLSIGEPMDSKNNFENVHAIYLSHSCDNWVIGGVEEAEQLVSDLQQAIKDFNN